MKVGMIQSLDPEAHSWQESFHKHPPCTHPITPHTSISSSPQNPRTAEPVRDATCCCPCCDTEAGSHAEQSTSGLTPCPPQGLHRLLTPTSPGPGPGPSTQTSNPSHTLPWGATLKTSPIADALPGKECCLGGRQAGKTLTGKPRPSKRDLAEMQSHRCAVTASPRRQKRTKLHFRRGVLQAGRWGCVSLQVHRERAMGNPQRV